MKKLGFVMLLLALAVMLGGTALAQDNSYYFTTYFSKCEHRHDAGCDSARYQPWAGTGGNLWATIYVFDDQRRTDGVLRLPGHAGWSSVGIRRTRT